MSSILLDRFDMFVLLHGPNRQFQQLYNVRYHVVVMEKLHSLVAFLKQQFETLEAEHFHFVLGC